MAIEPNEFDVNKLTFSISPKSFEIKDADGNKQKMSYISILLKYDGESEFYIQAPRMFSYGIKRTTFGGKPKFSTSFVMKDKEGATPEQITFYNLMEKIVEKTKKYMLEHKSELKSPSLAENMLESLSPIYIKKDDNDKPLPDAIPSLNVGLKQKGELILTKFFEESNGGEDDVEVDPQSLLTTPTEKHYYTMSEGAIAVPDVYFAKGKPAKLHCILEEATVEVKKERTSRLTGAKTKKLFVPQNVSASASASVSHSDDDEVATESKPEPKVEEKKTKTPKPVSDDEDSDEENDSEDDVPKKVTKVAPKGVPRRAK